MISRLKKGFSEFAYTVEYMIISFVTMTLDERVHHCRTTVFLVELRSHGLVKKRKTFRRDRLQHPNGRIPPSALRHLKANTSFTATASMIQKLIEAR